MSRILVTDGTYKHSLAIVRYLRRADPTLRLLVHQGRTWIVPALAGIPPRDIVREDLESVLHKRDFDQVIPVGGPSVVLVSRICPEKAVLPSREAIALCFDKYQTVELARCCGVPCPQTWAPASAEEALSLELSYPCVIKPRDETKTSFTRYAKDPEELRQLYPKAAEQCSNAGGLPPLIQEYVRGVGTGFFGLYQHGRAKRVFMHRRLREWPVTGGPSTAASAFYHPQLMAYGKRLLDELKWHGVAMVEFKYEANRDRFCLMEINPKFWGSAELGLRAGVNFPADLIRVFRGEELDYNEQYDRDLKFYWPLQGDLAALVRLRKFRAVAEYFQPHSATNFLTYPLLDVLYLGKSILQCFWR